MKLPNGDTVELKQELTLRSEITIQNTIAGNKELTENVNMTVKQATDLQIVLLDEYIQSLTKENGDKVTKYSDYILDLPAKYSKDLLIEINKLFTDSMSKKKEEISSI